MAGFTDTSAPGDEIDTSTYPGDASGHIHPDLLQFVNDQPTDMSKAWTTLAADRAQQYITARGNAVDAQNAENEMVGNLDGAKNGLVSMVRSDPGSIPLALDLAHLTAHGIVSQHPFDDDTRNAVAGSIARSMQTEIAHAGVQSIAHVDRQAALDAIDKYGNYLPDDQQAALRQYADVHQALREQDGQAQQLQQARDAAHEGYGAASRHLMSLMDSSTNEFRAPPQFLQNLLDDPSVETSAKLALRAGYGMLNRNGDAPASDPHLVADFISRMADPTTPSPQQGEVISHLGSGLTINDAVFLNHLLGPSSPQRKADLRALDQVVSQARDTFTTPLNGAAGDAAFGRFTNWLLPTIQQGVPLGEIATGNHLQAFAPTVDDYRRALVKARLNG